jgi:hypothetical protein
MTVSSVGRQVGGTTILSMFLIVLVSKRGATRTPFCTEELDKILLIAGLVERFLGVSPDFLQ